MSCEQIHETVIRDIVDVIMDAKESDTLSGIFNRGKSFKSAADASSNLTLVFPVLASTSINLSNSSMVCKAIERKAVSMMQMLFSAINISDAKNAIDYISKFHTNMKFDDGLSIDQFVDFLDAHVVQKEQAGQNIVTDKEIYTMMKEDLKNLKYELPNIIAENSINNFKVYPELRYGANNVVLERQGDSPNDIAATGINMAKNQTDIFKNQILDSDIKKANELVPTTMIINFVSTGYDTPIGVQNIIVGIKAKLYPVSSTDIISRLILKNKSNNGFNSFIRATTREISFWKDFVFAIDAAKLDAISSSKRGSSSKMWKLLERRSLKSKARRMLGNTNDATSITSLVISQEEVEYLKKTENIDVEKPQVMRPIMESYNLMCVAIIDEAMEAVKFIFDTGEDVYETISFNNLERESADGGYKKVINLMTKMSR